jgi:hypothetical protein
MFNEKEVEAVCRSYCKLKNENPDEVRAPFAGSDFNILTETLDEYAKRKSHPHWQDYIETVQEFVIMMEAMEQVEHLES